MDNSGAVAPEGRGRNGVRPSQPIATRPLALRKDGTWYTYGWDLTKNICEVFNNEGYMNNTVIYSYSPYGAVTAEGTASQPIQWSSEFYDEELGLVYYNYRHYNSDIGIWVNRDFVNRENYIYSRNSPIYYFDLFGLDSHTIGKIDDLDITVHVEINGANGHATLHVHKGSFDDIDKYDYRNDKTPPGFYNRKTGEPFSNKLQKKLASNKKWKTLMQKAGNMVDRNNGLSPTFGGGKVLKGCATMMTAVSALTALNGYADAMEQGNTSGMDRIFNDFIREIGSSIPDPTGVLRVTAVGDLMKYHKEMMYNISRMNNEKAK